MQDRDEMMGTVVAVVPGQDPVRRVPRCRLHRQTHKTVHIGEITQKHKMCRARMNEMNEDRNHIN